MSTQEEGALKREFRDMMLRCKDELVQQQRFIDNIRPKAEAYNLLTKIIDLIPGRPDSAGVDLVWRLEQRIKKLEDEILIPREQVVNEETKAQEPLTPDSDALKEV